MRRPLRALALALAYLAGAGNELPAAVQPPSAPDPPGATNNGTLIYDRDYPFIHYADAPVHNDVARLQQRLDEGTVKLTTTPQHGYLESLLQALSINPDSQTLVFSKTSLQIEVISPATPRAIYFNDDTYVAWVQQSGIIEINTMDADRGPVFYTLSAADPHPRLEREILRCLTCHDSYAEMGGGVPRFLFESTYDVDHGRLIPDAISRETSNATPIAQRWGGWYVTGRDGGALHLGNIQTPATDTPIELSKARRSALLSLGSMFDSSAYLRGTSDIVALLVLEHQITLHNQIIRANYKSRTLLQRALPGSDAASLHWSQLPPPLQRRLDQLLRPLLDALLMSDAAPLPQRMVGGNGYAAWFQNQGIKDTQGRSLRELDLNTRVFRYPLSFLIYSEGFDALPVLVREHLYQDLARILQAPDPGAPYRSRSAADRLCAYQILLATKPEFARAMRSHSD
ncbi:MAG TPA: hypothetical protein VK700_02665 [Steroidobacteraceae bacterium]|jgi:hypothetical protein|nr:hypothetical protein [Steroidobacteraceae bacterium]